MIGSQQSIPGIGGILCGELIVDLFAGGGGASTGIEQALGRPPDLAINHDPAAVQMHAINHPATDHRCESIYTVSPREATKGQAVGLLWASPSCTHFSRARGGTPVSKQERGLGWMVLRWAALTSARVIICENVSEWQTWGPVRRGQPVKKHSGKYFRQLVSQLEALGYAVEWRILNAADYGAPTNRRRLFLVARRDGQPIAWPTPTHGPAHRKPHRSAASCIDWSDLGASIFGRKKPLADATCRRIAAGIVRYVLGAHRPFLVEIDNRSNGDKARDIDAPLSTVTTENRHAMVTGFLAKYYGGVVGNDLRMPTDTITKWDHHALVAGCLAKMHGTSNAADATKPLGTILSGGTHHAIVAAFLMQYHATGGQHSKASAPLPVITTVAGHGLVTVEIDGATYALVDIRMRMLQPRELATAQGFPASYILTGTKAQQIGRIGNSVSPAPACALVRANLVPAKAGRAVA